VSQSVSITVNVRFSHTMFNKGPAYVLFGQQTCGTCNKHLSHCMAKFYMLTLSWLNWFYLVIFADGQFFGNTMHAKW